MTHPANPERITVAGDWHGNTTRATEAVRIAAESGADLLLHTGDLGLLPTAAGQTHIDRLNAALAGAGLELWFVDGNHDDHHTLRTLPREPDGSALVRDHIRYLPRGHRWTWHDHSWLALGGAHTVNHTQYTPGVDWWPEETITQTDITAATVGGPVHTMLTHDAPFGVDVPGYVGNPHGWSTDDLQHANRNRSAIRAVVDAVRPTRLIHGHYHVRYTTNLVSAGRTTLIMGVGSDETPVKENLVSLSGSGV
jgi:Icc-related predicted phosphoesterase